MPRPPKQPPRTEFEGEELENYLAIVKRTRAMMGEDDPTSDDAGVYFGALLNSPNFAAALARFGTLVRTAGDRDNTYSHADREIVDVVLSFDWDYYGVLGVHVPDAVAVGVRLEAIEAFVDDDPSLLNDDERLLVEFVRATVNGKITDELYERMEARIGARGAFEYTTFILFLQMTIRMFMALNIPGPDRAEVERITRGLRDGSIPVPDYRQRIR